PAVNEVDQPAGRRNDDVCLRGALALILKPNAAVHGGNLHALRVDDAAELVGDLRCELTSRNEDERGGTLLVLLQPLDDGDGERERLAGSGARLGEHVASGDRVGKD